MLVPRHALSSLQSVHWSHIDSCSASMPLTRPATLCWASSILCSTVAQHSCCCLWLCGILQDDVSTRQRQEALYGQTAVHATFGDIELAQITLRGALNHSNSAAVRIFMLCLSGLSCVVHVQNMTSMQRRVSCARRLQGRAASLLPV